MKDGSGEVKCLSSVGGWYEGTQGSGVKEWLLRREGEYGFMCPPALLRAAHRFVLVFGGWWCCGAATSGGVQAELGNR